MMDQTITQFNEKLFIKTNISAITFDGIDDDMLHINDQMPEIDIPFDRFGWFYDVSIFTLYFCNCLFNF